MNRTNSLLVAAMLASFALPDQAAAQPLPRNTNYSRKSTLRSSIAGGSANLIKSNSTASFIGGGYSNNISASFYALIGGGAHNKNTGFAAAIGGGFLNEVGAYYATIGGGLDNTASANYATIGGGVNNTASGFNSTVPGGYHNTASGSYSAVAGGYENEASGNFSFVGGGSNNTASGSGSAVVGGYTNTASGSNSVVGGGYLNTASGLNATVPGGVLNTATNSSFAAGTFALATNQESFVWGHAHGGFGFGSTASFGDYTFTVRCHGGARFYTSTTNGGAALAANATAWSALSDSNAKTAVIAVDPRAVLDKLDRLPVTEWEYKHDPHRRYFGPMAQDFHAAFGLGADDKTINTLDADGVLFLSVKGLVEELKDRDKAMAARDKKIDELNAKLKSFEERLNSLPPAP